MHVLAISEFSAPLSALVEGAADTSVPGVIAVFQVRYPDDWILIDAAGDSVTLQGLGRFSAAAWASARAALKNARTVVVTHEHHDHVGGLIVTPDSLDVASRAVLTREQVETLRAAPNRRSIHLDDVRANRFTEIDYDHLMPLSAGVVLIKAEGHTPGSQMVYVRTASDQEIILVGDVTWNSKGIDELKQKPPAASANVANLGVAEDRDRIARQLSWLRQIRGAGVHIVVAHDKTAIDDLVSSGVLRLGLDIPHRR